jgi:uncharacterized protein YjbJ (UPF0337 family)
MRLLGFRRRRSGRNGGFYRSDAPTSTPAAKATIAGRARFLSRRHSRQRQKEPIMDKNRIDGAGKEIKGATKEAIGKVTGNLGKQAEGMVEKNVGTAQRKIGEAADKARKDV